MSDINTLEDLLEHELKDLYSAEKQIIVALPRMVRNAVHDDLKKAFEMHLKETEEHKARLEQIGEILGIKLTGHVCKGTQGLVEEAKEFISEKADPQVRDAGLISQAQRVEHYEIAGYGTARTLAEKLGNTQVVKLLEKTLQEEKNTDVKLTKLAVGGINDEAAQAENEPAESKKK